MPGTSVAVVVFIGTSGWQYADWRGSFYPQDLVQRQWLDHYARRFATVEVNNTFYRLPGREVFSSWARRTPPDFVVTVKASRYLSHVKRLKDPEEPVRRLLDAAAGLGAKLGPILVQLPPTYQVDLPRLDGVLRTFPAGLRIAVEFRHPSWWTDATRDVLAAHAATLCWADRGSRWLTPRWRTADWGFVRLHAGRGVPRSCYGYAAIERVAREVAATWTNSEDVFVYLNNDTHCCAVRDARRVAFASARHGRDHTRVPRAAEVRLASR